MSFIICHIISPIISLLFPFLIQMFPCKVISSHVSKFTHGICQSQSILRVATAQRHQLISLSPSSAPSGTTRTSTRCPSRICHLLCPLLLQRGRRAAVRAQGLLAHRQLEPQQPPHPLPGERCRHYWISGNWQWGIGLLAIPFLVTCCYCSSSSF